ncbi:MAG: methionyl-tRNA formyltransferase [Alphaproteobacteria bacterium]|nr:methionyl-tRNA formyltransferase [Alphaproteobacteria bacterium]
MPKNPLKIIFMGTPDFAVPALQALINSEHEIAAVYTQPPRPKGRGKAVQKSPVHNLADKNNIGVFTPTSFKKNKEAISEFNSLNADIAIVAAYGLILPEDVLNAPAYGCLNIHASLLPKWRGAAPIQYSIWKGDKVSGVTIMKMEKGLDTGPMIVKTQTPIIDTTTAQSLHDTLAQQGADAVIEVLDYVLDQETLPESTPQDESISSYASMLKKEDGRIDWHRPAEEIDRQVRALNPWPGTYFDTELAKRFKVKSTFVVDEKTSSDPGTLVTKAGNVACGYGTTLRLELIQPENKQPMSAEAAINGNYLEIGTTLIKNR